MLKYLFVPLLCFQTVHAQQVAAVVGEPVPETASTTALFHTSDSVRLGDLRGKLILLDWWSTYCSSCIKNFPKMAALQRRFKDRVVVLPVTRQDPETIRKFWRNNPITSSLALPTLASAEDLNKVFPHDGVPFIVWIHPDGRLLALTSAEYVNEKEVEAVLGGQIPDWEVYRKKEFDISRPLFRDEEAKYYSGFKPYMPQTISRGRFFADSAAGVLRYTAINLTPKQLYHTSFVQLDRKKMKEFEVETNEEPLAQERDGNLYTEEWLRRYAYCYEIVLPLNSPKEKVFTAMRADLERFLGVTARLKKKDAP